MARPILPTFLSKKDFFQIEQCKCGKNPFKYHNTSKNEFVAKCNTPTEEFDIKMKKWVVSKKQPCGFYCIYPAERPIFEEIKKTLIVKAKSVSKDKNKVLEEKLKLLFQFVFISNHTSTLDEINILVRNSLKQEPRKIYYTEGIYKKISHYESLEDYRTRIFSKPIIDKSFEIIVIPKEELPVYVTSPVLDRKSVNNIKHFVKSVKHSNPIIHNLKQKKKKAVCSSNFIVVSDDDNSESEAEDQTDLASDTSRELSDYEESETILGDEEPEVEEPEVEVFDEGDEGDEGDDDNGGDYD